MLGPNEIMSTSGRCFPSIPHSNPAWQAFTLGCSLNSWVYIVVIRARIVEVGFGFHPG